MHYCKTEDSHKRQPALTQLGVALIPVLLLLLSILASLAAVWQWQRSQYHLQKADTATAQLLQPRNMNTDAVLSASYVTVTGRWLADSTTFVSPRMMDGRMGAQAISVLAYINSAGNSQHIAVQRGWAAQESPTVAPNLPPLTQLPVRLQGELVEALPKALELKSIPPTRLGLWQNYDTTTHARLVKVSLDPQVLILLPSSPDLEAQQLRRVPAQQTIDTLRQKANTNQGYALQWLGLALVGLIGLAWMWRTQSNTRLNTR